MAGGHGSGNPLWLLGGYRRYLEERELSHKTINVYVRIAIRAEAWCEPHGYDLATAPPEMLRDWVDASVPWATSSRRQARSTLEHYWEMASRPDRPRWVVRVPKAPHYACRALEEDEAGALEAAAGARGDHKGLAVLFGLYLALRVSETASLRWGDLDGDWIKLIGKFDTPAALPLHPVLARALAAYPRRDPTWVFPGRFGGPVHPSTVWTWCRGVAAEAGVGKVATHRLRHTCLATANDLTGDLRGTQDLARHVKPETTARYTRVNARRLTSVVHSISYGRPSDSAGIVPATQTGGWPS